jgi:hypothetical protein
MRSSAATWRGRLRIPNPGGYRLDVLASMPATTTIDGRRIMPDSTVSAGEHDFVLSIANVSDRFRLAIYWEPPDAPRALVPPSAFAP